MYFTSVHYDVAMMICNERYQLIMINFARNDLDIGFYMR